MRNAQLLLRGTIALCSLLGAGSLAAQGCLNPLKIEPGLPADTALSDQNDFNCFGWQEFIALNWKASPSHAGQPDSNAPASTFGAPAKDGDPPAVVWESYILDTQVFLPNGAKPGPFGTQASLSTSCSAGAAKGGLKLLAPLRAKDRFNTGYRLLASKSKFTPRFVHSLLRSPDAAAEDFSAIIQAGTNSWLTAQNGEITYYEIRLNEDEYNYITRNKLYDANCQSQAMQPRGPGIHLPKAGDEYGPAGALEVKAAWLPLTDPNLYSQYLTARAVIINPDGSCRSVIVGLVGLHIIRKTPRAEQFVWATFEHFDNAPDAPGGTTAHTYYNPRCNPATDPYKCSVNTQPPSCGTGINAPCNYATPMQVARSNPLPDYVVSLNEYVQGEIKKVNPKSVFRNYRLVNVMWPSSNTAIISGAVTPLNEGNVEPKITQGGLANTTMETYFQKDKTCMSCHKNAPIAGQTDQKHKFASDYSFLFSLAEFSTNPPLSCKPAAASVKKRR